MKAIVFLAASGPMSRVRKTRDFGDLGFHLGAILRERAQSGEFLAPMIEAGSAIRATALGASEYSVQLSGQTSTVTAPGCSLPRRQPSGPQTIHQPWRSPAPDAIASAICDHFEAFDLDPAHDEAAIAFEFHTIPEYPRIRALADGIVSAMAKRIAGGHGLHIMIDGDIAQTLGGMLRDELKLTNDLLVLDGISLRDFDYIDLGKIRLPSFTVPVTVKSLLFSNDPRSAGRQERTDFVPQLDFVH